MTAQSQHIFFSPHADDVVLSCGGTIHALVARNEPVAVIGVFAGKIAAETSAYARHLHAKWRLPGNAIGHRWREDADAMNTLGVETIERWDYIEAPYRKNDNGQPSYASNEELIGQIVSDDRWLRDDVTRRIDERVKRAGGDPVLYFPLAVGGHVDHQLLFHAGLEMAAGNRRVRFYEDFPYADSYVANGHHEWRSEVVPIDVASKTQAASAYKSQLYGMGGSAAALTARIRSTATAVGDGKAAERFWEIDSLEALKALTEESKQSPFVQKPEVFRLGDFGQFVRTFRWRNLSEVLPLGTGYCLDVGCGTGRYKSLIEGRGFEWIGVDKRCAASIQSEATRLPVRAESQSAVVAWQVMEYVDSPRTAFAEATRVLEPGGVFCGSVSFIEPVHGRTYFNLSPLIVEKLLRENGFGDVQLKPGLNGFALTLWTWLSRCGMPSLRGMAIPITFLMLVPFAAALFCTSWLSWHVGIGNGHFMRWISQTAPLEFAGHVMFSARKLARPKSCTSHS